MRAIIFCNSQPVRDCPRCGEKSSPRRAIIPARLSLTRPMSWKEKEFPPAGASICDSALLPSKDRRREDGPMLSIFADDWMRTCGGTHHARIVARWRPPWAVVATMLQTLLTPASCASLPRQRPPTSLN